MKVLFLSVVFLLFAVIYGKAMPVDEKSFAECQKELGISEGKKDKTTLRCMNACLLKKSDSLQPGNNISYADKLKDEIETAFGKDQAEQFMKRTQDCVTEAKNIDDECDFVNAVYQCASGDKI